MPREKITKENALDNTLRKAIYSRLLTKPMTVYDLTQNLYGLPKKKRKFIKKLYDKVKYHVNMMMKVGLLKIDKEEEVELVKIEKKNDIKKPIMITKVWYRAVRK